MPCPLINNVARVIDVRQVLGVDTFNAVNEDVSHGSSRNNIKFDASPSAVANVKNSAVQNADAVNSLVALFTSFFNQLIGLISNKKETTVPDVPRPPDVLPKVVPDPTPPAPGPATDIPGLSNKGNGAKPENIWSGFRQGPDGNCVTVSAIKAAMHRFGQSPTDIYKEVKKTSTGYHVVMRDGYELTLSDQELREGAQGAKFIGPDKGMLKDAQFLFAVSAKRAQRDNNDGTAGRSYRAAIHSLNNGEDEYMAGEGFERLGLKKHMKRVSVRELARGQIGMCNRAGHSVAVINGREELWGRQGSTPRRGIAVALI
ncbi:hypothetical protein [Pseudomonas rhodesiae]|uniref:hypothetical protein n=1 Tax=Pseudomonas rhodesiae TaxID=76760 RepID=UPI0032B1A90A